MQQITDFIAYKNEANFDKPRDLEWSNAAIIEAIRYYKEICNEEITFDKIYEELKAMKLRAVQALLFGALKAAQPIFTIKTFGDKYRPENLASYVTVVLDGMLHYLPEANVIDAGIDVDPEWPDTQKEVKKKTTKKQKQTGDTGIGFVKTN